MNWWLKNTISMYLRSPNIWNENDNGLELIDTKKFLEKKSFFFFCVFKKSTQFLEIFNFFIKEKKSAMLKLRVNESSNQLICDRTVPAIPKSLFFNF